MMHPRATLDAVISKVIVPMITVAVAITGCSAPETPEIVDLGSTIEIGHDDAAVDIRRRFLAGLDVARFRVRLRFLGDRDWPTGLELAFSTAASESRLAGWSQVPQDRRENEAFWSPWLTGDETVIEITSGDRSVDLGTVGTVLLIEALERRKKGDEGTARTFAVEAGDRVDGYLDAGATHRYHLPADSQPTRVYLRPRGRPERDGSRWALIEEDRPLRSAGRSDTGVYVELSPRGQASDHRELIVRATYPGSFTLVLDVARPPLPTVDVLAPDLEPDQRASGFAASEARADTTSPWRLAGLAARRSRGWYLAGVHTQGDRLRQALAVASAHLLADPEVGARLGHVRVHRASTPPHGFEERLTVVHLPDGALDDPRAGGLEVAVAIRAVWAARHARGGPAHLALPAPYQDALAVLDELLDLEIVDETTDESADLPREVPAQVTSSTEHGAASRR